MRRVGAALVAVSLAFALAACGDDDGGGGSDAEGAFGECEIQSEVGELGDVELVSDGVLTVVTNLPAPGFWNGDDPESVNGGFEYCMAAEIATSLGLDAVEVVQRLVRRSGRRPERATSTSPSRRSRSPTSEPKSSTSPSPTSRPTRVSS